MEALMKVVTEIGEHGNGHMAILFTPEGVIYYANLVSGQIIWRFDTKMVAYQAYQTTGVTEYVDIGLDDKSPYYMSGSGTPKVIPGKTKEQIQKGIKFLSKKDSKINADGKVFYLNRLSGAEEEEELDGPDTLRIIRTNWDICIEEHCSLRYSDLDVSFPSSEGSLKCLVIYARTDRRLMEICEKYGFVKLPLGGTIARIFNSSKRISLANPRDKFVDNKGKISYHDGYLDNDKENQVFVKKVPKSEKFDDIKNVYKKFYWCEYVIRQITMDSDECYEYIAFEKMTCNIVNLASMDMKFIPNTRIRIIRYVIRAVMELHDRGVVHCNISPEHVLLRTRVRGGYTVKLCGLGRSIVCSSRDEMISNHSSWYQLDMHMVAEVILHCMVGGIKSHVHLDIIDSYFTFSGFSDKQIKNCYGKDLKDLDPLVEDIVRKLMRAGSNGITLAELYLHPIFWTTYDKISFLKEVYDELNAGKLGCMEYLAGRVFGEEWKVEEAWLSEMVKVHEEMKSKGRHGTEEMEGAVETIKISVKVVYNPKKLRDLLKLIRHSVNHPSNTFPNLNKISLGEYVFQKFPKLLRVAYNHVLKYGANSEVYKQYCPSSTLQLWK